MGVTRVDVAGRVHVFHNTSTRFVQNGADATILDVDGNFAMDFAPEASDVRDLVQAQLDTRGESRTSIYFQQSQNENGAPRIPDRWDDCWSK